MGWKGKGKGFTLIELIIVLTIISVLLGSFIAVYKRTASVKASEVMAVLNLTINAIQDYLNDNGRYPNSLSDLKTGPYDYLPDMNVSGNTLTYKELRITYNNVHLLCGGTPAVEVAFNPDQVGIYNEVKLNVEQSPGWRTNDNARRVVYCLSVF